MPVRVRPRAPRKDLAWQLGADADVMNPDVRKIEIHSWMDHLVIPNRSN